MLRTTINAPIWLQIQAFRLQFVEKITIRQRKIPYCLIHYKSTFWSLKQESTPIISGKNSVVFLQQTISIWHTFCKIYSKYLDNNGNSSSFVLNSTSIGTHIKISAVPRFRAGTKRKRANHHRDDLLFVALEGLEPSQTEPESGVLPLHHKAFWYCKITTFFWYGNTKPSFFSKKIHHRHEIPLKIVVYQEKRQYLCIRKT